MSEAYFSRVRLRRDPDVATLAPLLFPSVAGERIPAAHRMIWSLFSDRAERKRDFLYREAKGQTFFVLSARPPEDRRALFEIDVKPFEPTLRVGDVLNFSLRANPVVSMREARADGKSIVVRHDVIMHALRGVPTGSARAEARLGYSRRQPSLACRAGGKTWVSADRAICTGGRTSYRRSRRCVSGIGDGAALRRRR
jgi:CRISPR system Cascade subunit CasE